MRRIILALFFIFIFSSFVLAVAPPSKTASSYVSSVVSRINAGDRDILRTISHEDINFVLDYGRSGGGTTAVYSFFGERSKVVNSALKGLFNTDPRVRLLCVEILLHFVPDRLMEYEVSYAYRASRGFLVSSVISASSSSDYYSYIDLSGKEEHKSLSRELSKLYKFVLRDKLLYTMLREDVLFLSKIPEPDFLILYDAIDGEGDEEIPLKAYGADKFISVDNLRVIVAGIDNPSIDVARICSNYLVNYYNTNFRTLNLYYRHLILTALRKAYKDDLIKKPKLLRVGE